MKPRSRARRFGELFRAGESPLARLQEHANRLSQLERVLGLLLPDYLQGQIHVANYQDGKLALHSGSAAVAAKLKLLLPRIKDGFWAQGIAVGEIKVKLKAPRSEAVKPQQAPRSLGAASMEQLELLRGSLAADSPLAEPLARLLQRAARR